MVSPFFSEFSIQHTHRKNMRRKSSRGWWGDVSDGLRRMWWTGERTTWRWSNSYQRGLKHSGIHQMRGKVKTSPQLFHAFHPTSSRNFLWSSPGPPPGTDWPSPVLMHDYCGSWYSLSSSRGHCAPFKPQWQNFYPFQSATLNLSKKTLTHVTHSNGGSDHLQLWSRTHWL